MNAWSLLVPLLAGCDAGDKDQPWESGGVPDSWGETGGETGDDTGVDTGDSGDTPYTDAWGARYDCGAMDPADAAPLPGKVALTFDDGPSIETTPQVIEVLRRHQVPATFFYVGAMAVDPAVDELILDVAADPLFRIGNHTWDHVDLIGYTASEARDQIEPTTELLADFGVTPRYFRFPYGEGTCDIVDLARGMGMHVTGWHIDTADWCYAMGEGVCDSGDYWRVPEGFRDDMLGHTIDQILESNGGMVLFHDVWQYTADELEAVILEVKAAGLTFTLLEDMETYPRLNDDDPYPLPWIGQACSVRDDECWQVENFAWCEPGGDPSADADAGVCVLPCGSAPCFSRDGGPPSECVNWEGEAVCLGVSSTLNGWCEGVPGTVETLVGGRDMCVPYAWVEAR